MITHFRRKVGTYYSGYIVFIDIGIMNTVIRTYIFSSIEKYIYIFKFDILLKVPIYLSKYRYT